VVTAAVVNYRYVIVFTALWGKTVGKAMVGIRVVRVDTFGVPGFKRAAIRTLGLAPLGLLPYDEVVAGAAEASFMVSPTRQGCTMCWRARSSSTTANGRAGQHARSSLADGARNAEWPTPAPRLEMSTTWGLRPWSPGGRRP
jgi:hypothetical protein